VDCFRDDGNTGYVVEIKHNNDAAQQKGRDQIARGIDAIKTALSGKKKKSDLTGPLEIFRACFDEQNAKAVLYEELRVYEYCPPATELFHDFVTP